MWFLWFDGIWPTRQGTSWIIFILGCCFHWDGSGYTKDGLLSRLKWSYRINPECTYWRSTVHNCEYSIQSCMITSSMQDNYCNSVSKSHERGTKHRAEPPPSYNLWTEGTTVYSLWDAHGSAHKGLFDTPPLLQLSLTETSRHPTKDN